MKWKIITTIIILAIIFKFALADDLTIREYDMTSEKIEHSFRIALITDLHCSEYGAAQSELLNALISANPDVVFFGGDIADDDLPLDNMLTLTRRVSKLYECYYVFGNHENRRPDKDTIRQNLAIYGVDLLEGESRHLSINGQSVDLYGVDDVKSEILKPNKENYSILLLHRPEKINLYQQYDFDLVLSGHTHGGQWRIPFILNGLLAPDQGLFPKYGGGEYQVNDTILIVSRGLARDYTRIPRIFNPPELVLIDVAPAG